MSVPLPSVEECREFKRVINETRVALGREPVEYLKFHGCRPGMGDSCLSAANLVRPLYDEGFVGMASFQRIPQPTAFHAALEAATGEKLEVRPDDDEVEIPVAIRRVTDPFDMIFEDDERDAFCARLKSAGVIK